MEPSRVDMSYIVPHEPPVARKLEAIIKAVRALPVEFQDTENGKWRFHADNHYLRLQASLCRPAGSILLGDLLEDDEYGDVISRVRLPYLNVFVSGPKFGPAFYHDNKGGFANALQKTRAGVWIYSKPGLTGVCVLAEPKSTSQSRTPLGTRTPLQYAEFYFMPEIISP